MEVEKTVAVSSRSTYRPHNHVCLDCGERWACVDKCLDQHGCLGRPYCPHRRCGKCRDVAGREVGP